MISRQDIARWGASHPWPSADQIEQDLLLSQAMCSIASDPLLGGELVLRGGTAFHKLFLPQPYRYSEDLDYVRVSAGGIGGVMKRLTGLGQELGYTVSTKMGMYPKVMWKFSYASGTRGKIKIEINTFERSPVLPLETRLHSMDSLYHSCSAAIPTFQVEELIATKLRALYQRSKGRDLFDLWLALTVLDLRTEVVLAAFPAYRPENASGGDMKANLEAKLEDRQFCGDIDALVRDSRQLKYDPKGAAALVVSEFLDKID